MHISLYSCNLRGNYIPNYCLLVGSKECVVIFLFLLFWRAREQCVAKFGRSMQVRNQQWRMIIVPPQPLPSSFKYTSKIKNFSNCSNCTNLSCMPAHFSLYLMLWLLLVDISCKLFFYGCRSSVDFTWFN